MTTGTLEIALIIAVPLVTGFFTILTLVITNLFAYLKSAEERRRDLEDRKEVILQARLATEAAANAARVSTANMQIVHEAVKRVDASVLAVGEQATAAYKEANFANLKIQAVQDTLTSQQGLPQKPITAATGATEDLKE